MFRNIFIDKRLSTKLFKKDTEQGIALKTKVKENMKSKVLKAYNVSLKNVFYSPRVLISRSLIGERVYFQTGKGINSIKITESMVGFKMGEFSISRKNNQRKK